MSSVNCARCGEREDETHLFLTCSFAQRVWNSAPINQAPFSGTPLNFQSLLSSALLCKSLPPTGLSLTPLTPWIMWNMWKARNYLIFEDRPFSEQDIINKSLKEAKEWQAAQVIQAASVSKVTQTLRPAVSPPLNLAYKCFVDAAWCPITHTCGQGWIMYDQNGAVLLQGSTTRRYVSSALVAEALALRSIVELLAEHPARLTTDSIEVFSDSQVLISSIKTKASSKEHKAILHDITCVSDSLKSLSFHFIPRLRNVVADSIAKSALGAANSSSLNGV